MGRGGVAFKGALLLIFHSNMAKLFCECLREYKLLKKVFIAAFF